MPRLRFPALLLTLAGLSMALVLGGFVAAMPCADDDCSPCCDDCSASCADCPSCGLMALGGSPHALATVHEGQRAPEGTEPVPSPPPPRAVEHVPLWRA